MSNVKIQNPKECQIPNAKTKKNITKTRKYKNTKEEYKGYPQTLDVRSCHKELATISMTSKTFGGFSSSKAFMPSSSMVKQ